jgi:integrase
VTKKLTTAYLKSIEPRRGRGTVCEPDGTVGGLSIRYGARGHVEFSLVYRFNGYSTQYRRTLGYWWNDDLGPAPSDRWLSLDQARILALQIKEKAFRNDPELFGSHFTAIVPKPEPPPPPKKPADAAEAVIDRYAREHLSTLKTGVACEKLIRQACSAFLQRPIGEVTRADIRAILDGHMARGNGAMANRVHAVLAAMFKWAADRELIEASPMVGMTRPVRKVVSRERVLNDAELAKVWHAADVLHAPRRDAVRFLMLTGLRRSEGTEIRWSDIDTGGLLTIPGSRTKNGMAHSVPLSPQALDLINAQPRRCEFVFTYDGASPAGDLSIYKAKFLDPAAGLTEHWQLHDLRRSVASGMQDLGIKPEVIDRCLGHSAVVKGVAAVYMRSQYLPERRAALDLWCSHVAKIVETIPYAAN